MPSPSPEHPGLFIRDPYHFSDAMLVIPPPLIECLRCFDGDLPLRKPSNPETESEETGKDEED